MSLSRTENDGKRHLPALLRWFVDLWKRFERRFPSIARFFLFFLLSNAVTLLQVLLMPLLRGMLDHTTDLVQVGFRMWPVGKNLDGSAYYVFNYPAGPIGGGGGGGLAYFLAIQITMLVAQVVNFFAQRNITFRSNTSPWWAALWYLIAYIVITIGAAAAQGLYKAPIYNLLIDTWGWGDTGETIADFITMIIYSAISFWVFFPIFRTIFRRKPEEPTNDQG